MTKMNKNLAIFGWAFVFGLSISSLMGCAAAVSAVSTLGSGIAMGAEQFVTEPVTKTLTHDFDQIKMALLVALCRMQISVESAREIERGEQIQAKAENLDIEIELKEVTPRVTRIAIKASNGFMKEDKATAQEIVQQTTQIAKKLVI